MDLAGEVIRGRHPPSAELGWHLLILRSRGDVTAVIHAYPPVATGMSVAGQEFDWDVLPEMVFLVGRVPVVPYGAPGTPELAERIDPHSAKIVFTARLLGRVSHLSRDEVRRLEGLRRNRDRSRGLPDSAAPGHRKPPKES